MQLGAQTHLAQGWDPAILDRARAAALPLGFVRDELWWSVVEQSRGVLAPQHYDAQVSAITSRGYKLLFTAFSTNPLYDGGRFPMSEAAQGAFAAYVAACVQRFGAAMVGVEVWNEPSNFSFGVPVDDAFAAGYVRLLQRVHAAVKAIRPDLPVASAGTAGTCTAWYKKLIALGALAWCDRLAVHLYGPGAVAHGELLALRALAPGKPLWLTEYGWGRGSLPSATAVYRRTLAYAADVGVELASAYLLRDEPGQGFGSIGLLSQDGALAEQGRALKEMAAKLPLVRQPGSSLAPVWRTRDSQVLAWTDLGRKVRVYGMPRELPEPTFLWSAPVEDGTPVTDSAYDFLGPGWRYFGLDGSTPVAVSELDCPYDITLAGPGWLRISRGMQHPNGPMPSVRSYTVPANAGCLLLGEVARPDPNGDGTIVSVVSAGSTLWSRALAPGAVARLAIGPGVVLAPGSSLEVRVAAGPSDGWDATMVRLALIV